MFNSIKKISVMSLALMLIGCSTPGSYLSIKERNFIVDQNEPTPQQPVEQVNVYPLTPSFVAAYGDSNSQASGAKINTALDDATASYEYIVGVGDILNITIWDHPELTIPAGSYRSPEEAGHWVHTDGTIFYPYIGFVSVAGKSVVEIRVEISKRLAKYIESPQVDVNIAAFRSQQAYVTGEIIKPGKQAVTNVPLTLLDAINLAGGLTAEADWRNVNLTRNGVTETLSLYQLMQKGDLTQNRLIAKGDIIHVPRNDSQKVFVLGDVKIPEMLKIDRDGMSLTEALTSVGGINELSADATGIFVVRSAKRDSKNEPFLKQRRESFAAQNQVAAQEGSNPPLEEIVANIYQLDISDAAALVIGTDFQLEAYDVVYVTAAPIERYNRVIRQLLPTIAAFNQLTEGAVRIHNW